MKLLRKIARLRSEHTKAFKSENWQLMQRIGDKIRHTWAIYHNQKMKGQPTPENHGFGTAPKLENLPRGKSMLPSITQAESITEANSMQYQDPKTVKAIKKYFHELKTPITKTFATTPKAARSKFPSKFLFVIQTWSDEGWQDTKYGANSNEAALSKAGWLLSADSHWMEGNRKVRVVLSKDSL